MFCQRAMRTDANIIMLVDKIVAVFSSFGDDYLKIVGSI